MTHLEMAAARRKLGLSLRGMADLLSTDAQSVRRMEMHPMHSTARKPTERHVRIIKIVLDARERGEQG